MVQLVHWQGGGAAVMYANVGAGRVVHFGFLPGLSYWRSQNGTKDKLPVGFSEPLRNLVCASATGAHPAPRMRAVVTLPVTVDVPLVETPLLLSEKGAAVTVLNWTGELVGSLGCAARVPFTCQRHPHDRQEFGDGGDEQSHVVFAGQPQPINESCPR